MPQVATPGLYEVQVQVSGGQGSGPDYNIFHIALNSSPLSNCNAAVTALTAFYNAIKAYYPTGVTASIGYKVIDRTVVPWQLVAATAGSVSGTTAGSVAAAQLAGVVSWRTSLVGRSYRGRTFLGPLIGTALTGNSLSAAFVAAAQAAATAYIASGSVGTYQPCVYSHKHNTVTAITSAGMSSAIRTLRSRA